MTDIRGVQEDTCLRTPPVVYLEWIKGTMGYTAHPVALGRASLGQHAVAGVLVHRGIRRCCLSKRPAEAHHARSLHFAEQQRLSISQCHRVKAASTMES
ncbi:unnamed protein product [Pleuronectes platessa]|uniref:Uncharacterized protein n=1 Tax=Pleuronectes platessa TaxID=8262 RepID=A0A9N7UFH3_PLEPL|nr:unnamed protein product [Pleuronectes platessa]